uniref:Uncharacterized protein n=1 Tax=Rhizophora mucronata TaxID=61149 RepID=A0A2P2K4V1_RHIMU
MRKLLQLPFSLSRMTTTTHLSRGLLLCRVFNSCFYSLHFSIVDYCCPFLSREKDVDTKIGLINYFWSLGCGF